MRIKDWKIRRKGHDKGRIGIMREVENEEWDVIYGLSRKIMSKG